jgi:hypothetical protein
MARHGKVVSPWDKQRRWTAPFRWTAFPLIAVARPFFQWLAGTRGFIAIGPKIVPKLDRCVPPQRRSPHPRIHPPPGPSPRPLTPLTRGVSRTDSRNGAGNATSQRGGGVWRAVMVG